MEIDAPTALPVWKTIVVGTLGNVEYARRQLESAGIELDRFEQILEHVPLISRAATIDLVRIFVGDLMIPDRPTRQEVYQEAQSLGLSICPHEVALQLWLQHPSLLTRADWTMVATEPVQDAQGTSRLFRLQNDAGQPLVSAFDDGRPDYRWPACTPWVFARRS